MSTSNATMVRTCNKSITIFNNPTALTELISEIESIKYDDYKKMPHDLGVMLEKIFRSKYDETGIDEYMDAKGLSWKQRRSIMSRECANWAGIDRLDPYSVIVRPAWGRMTWSEVMAQRPGFDSKKGIRFEDYIINIIKNNQL